MQSIASSKATGTVLVIFGFAVWFMVSAIIPESSEWFFFATYFVGGLAFFLVGCYLPEYQNRRLFLSRRSALQLMAFFIWLAVNALGRIEMLKVMSGSSSLLITILVPASIGMAFGSYFVAIYLIRGIRAASDSTALKSDQDTAITKR